MSLSTDGLFLSDILDYVRKCGEFRVNNMFDLLSLGSSRINGVDSLGGRSRASRDTIEPSYAKNGNLFFSNS